MLDVTILLMTFFDKVCLPNNIEDLSIHVFNMITGIIESKILKNIYHPNIIVNLIQENMIQIKSRITIKVNASVKKHHICENIIFLILLHVVVKW